MAKAKRILGAILFCVVVLSGSVSFAATVCDVCETLGGGLTQVHPSAGTDRVTINVTVEGDCGTSTATLSRLSPTQFMSFIGATCSIGNFLTMQYSWQLKWNGPSGWTTVNSGNGQQSDINMDEWGTVIHPTFDGSPGQYLISYTLTAWVRRFDGQTGGCVGYPYEYCTISGPQPVPVH